MNRFTFVTPEGSISLEKLMSIYRDRNNVNHTLTPPNTRELAKIKLWLSREFKFKLDDVVVHMNGMAIL